MAYDGLKRELEVSKERSFLFHTIIRYEVRESYLERNVDLSAKFSGCTIWSISITFEANAENRALLREVCSDLRVGCGSIISIPGY